MKRFKITHTTQYDYNEPATFGSHELRLRPKESHELRIESSKLDIQPAALLYWCRDAEDNSIALAEFTEPATQLVIKSEVVVQQYNEAPLDFILAKSAELFPFTYDARDQAYLDYYLKIPHGHAGRRFREWAAGVLNSADNLETYAFLSHLSKKIEREFKYNVREEAGVQTPEETLTLGTGSCRDFATLFLETARFWGCAARFVSGYLHTPSSSEIPGATHAWAEVYLPGAGWKGFDPTIGSIVGVEHFPVAVTADPEAAPPIAGEVICSAPGKLTVGVWVEELASEESEAQ
ncbi:transglutaminase family protein [Teredinibacter turnerae]|uniref:transglutaminase family protein n=1 Tax=Teredinibacter turnerae TaxID=2426 RepID=UPI0003A4945C|nr:transglutaminase family protein [Teredinibacter turnerae]